MRDSKLIALLHGPKGYLSIVIVAMALFFGVLSPQFLSLGNVVDLVEGSSVTAILAIGLFATTLSFLFTTPGWEPTLGFPALSAMPGQFLLKDIVFLGASIWSLGESLKAAAVS